VARRGQKQATLRAVDRPRSNRRPGLRPQPDPGSEGGDVGLGRCGRPPRTLSAWWTRKRGDALRTMERTWHATSRTCQGNRHVRWGGCVAALHRVPYCDGKARLSPGLPHFVRCVLALPPTLNREPWPNSWQQPPPAFPRLPSLQPLPLAIRRHAPPAYFGATDTEAGIGRAIHGTCSSTLPSSGTEAPTSWCRTGSLRGRTKSGDAYRLCPSRPRWSSFVD